MRGGCLYVPEILNLLFHIFGKKALSLFVCFIVVIAVLTIFVSFVAISAVLSRLCSKKEIEGTQCSELMKSRVPSICYKKLRFSSCPGAKVKHQGQLGAARG